MEQPASFAETGTPDDAAQTLGELMNRKFVQKRKRRQKPTTLLSRDSSSINLKRQNHTTYEIHRDGSLSDTSKFISRRLGLPEIPTHTSGFEAIKPDFAPESSDVPVPEERPTGIAVCRPTASSNPLLAWLDDRDTFLQEMLRLEGRGMSTDSSCPSCGAVEACFMCTDCLGQALCCAKCILARHVSNPLHIVKVWNGDFFDPISLKSLGLRVQLGHPPGQPCYNSERCFDDAFVVIDTTGIHTISLDFCGCEQAADHFQQILRFAWFPATTSRPRTAATFRVLKLFHILSLESKISAYEFYSSLCKLVDNTGLIDLKNRYETFLRMAREWRHLKMLKRAGRPYHSGVAGTREGQCAVLCPACPHPGKNLPLNLNNIGNDNRWLYAQFIAIDANFRLKRKKVSSDNVDPSLSQGWAYFVEETAYKDYLSSKATVVQEKSTCSSHTAVNRADTLVNHGLAATGIGAIDCARHNMKLPSGVGDLQKGEKYSNMDYLFFSALRHNNTVVLNISYDVACQWSKYLWNRMESLPECLRLDMKDKHFTFLVPKFHLPAHIQACQTTFSFNFTPGVGRTDGEAPERGWANFNLAASSTKEMGPGSRHDTLDDHFGHWNWKKVVGLRASLLEKLKGAIPKRAELQDALQELEQSIAHNHASDLEEWKVLLAEWENDHTKLNPYERRGETLTMATVRLELAKEDSDDMLHGRVAPAYQDCTIGVLISTGLELEELQRRLRYEKAGMGIHSTDNQEARLTERSNMLQRRIDNWVKLQHSFMPSIAVRRATQLDTDSMISPESFNLLVPSTIAGVISLEEKTLRIEWRLRLAQASDALNSLRSNLRARSYLLKFKDRNLRGQGANTRARNSVKLIQDRIDAAADRYGMAHRALQRLAPHLNETGWNAIFRPLQQNDIRGMSDILWGETEGTRKLSWIWSSHGSMDDSTQGAGALEDLRIEWCKARARACRWSEEVALLVEEMRRTVVFFEWDAKCWETRSAEVSSRDPVLLEGFRAYSQRQATLRHALAESCRISWADTIKSCSY